MNTAIDSNLKSQEKLVHGQDDLTESLGKHRHTHHSCGSVRNYIPYPAIPIDYESRSRTHPMKFSGLFTGGGTARSPITVFGNARVPIYWIAKTTEMLKSICGLAEGTSLEYNGLSRLRKFISVGCLYPISQMDPMSAIFADTISVQHCHLDAKLAPWYDTWLQGALYGRPARCYIEDSLNLLIVELPESETEWQRRRGCTARRK
ncbi:hypothetical protein EDB83DRAFT_2568798 [Lactarius deliciosus]|nr:hypothetical protein EDB83DRAFT_2568798 [Lactarius deliciosus]